MSPLVAFTTPPPSPVSRNGAAGSPAHPAHRAHDSGDNLAGVPSVRFLPWDASYEHIAAPDPHHRKWYVVTAGHKVGIWRTWLEMAEYVTGVAGNRHQSFKTRAEADGHYTYYKECGRVVIIAP
ncbi:hypothetical protein TRAPUB_1208 [Trametes pubescens]|uniref:Ribonuclease H1 N-terminal domain-containing protein n=1 Tax=Trametes pubescens TaxID=154538 RepID=A0A1M2VK08_TRAPU|nr:hypothetical protein TRAPUB_1208 [Trametes pubescens]